MKQFLIRLLVSFSYYIEGSTRYKRVKDLFYNILKNDDFRYKKYFDFFMIFIILSSITILVVDVHERVAHWLDMYDLYIVTGIFVVEYLLRLWVEDDIHKMIIEYYEELTFFEKPFSLTDIFSRIIAKKWKYISSPAAIIDLIAILPSYRELQILRVFVLFRAFKMLRYNKSLMQFFEILKSKKSELYTLFILLSFFILISSTMLYVFEGNGSNPQINTLFDAIYWSLVTMTTVGYGDIVPHTTEGRIVSMFVILIGVGAISFLTSIIVSAFSEKLSVMKDERVMHIMKKKIDINLICGYGKIGQLLARQLENEDETFLVLETNPVKVEKCEKDGFKVLQEDATKSETLSKLGICTNIKSVICVTHDDITNIFISINARSLCKNVEIISRCSDKNVAKKMKMAGVNHIIMPEEIAGMLGSMYIGQPVAFEAIGAIITQKRIARIDEVEIKLGSFLDGAEVGSYDFRANRLILLGVLKMLDKNSHYIIFNPSDDTRLIHGDILVIMGYTVSIADFKRRLEQSVRYKRSE